MEAKLIRLLQTDAVPMEKLHQQYGTLLELVEKLIGVIPNCDPYLEIWPTAFRTYNVLVPNFLNLPFALWGVGAPKEVVGLTMYVASRSAGCPYCSAHTASFALRRGTEPEKIARAMEPAADTHSAAERAAIAVAHELARVPCALSDGERDEMRRHYSPEQVEWIVLGISMMGFLNKFMDAMGIDLEGSTVGEVRRLISASGWTPGKHLRDDAVIADGPLPRADSFRTKLAVIPMIPTALSMDRKWTAGVPKRWPAVGEYLQRHLGHDFPVLSRLVHGRGIRAIAVSLRDNFDASSTVIGLPTKALAGIVFATVAEDAPLAEQVRALAKRQGVSAELVDEAARFARGEGAAPGKDAHARAALVLVKAASPSPAKITDEVIDECQSAKLSAPEIVELVAWVSVLQMIHRLTAFFGAG